MPVDRAAFAAGRLDDAVRDADTVIHAAGVIRGSDHEVEQGNIALAQAVVDAMDRSESRAHVVFADSIHAGADTPYGRGKEGAAAVLGGWGRRAGLPVADVRLTNLFGEHGRPNYNSFVATFAHQVATGGMPSIDADRPICAAARAGRGRGAAGSVPGTHRRRRPAGRCGRSHLRGA